jgi:non-homologous end joining protein Ku
MAPRANWKGYLRLSLVSCPIALYPAASGDLFGTTHRSSRVALRAGRQPVSVSEESSLR